MTEGHLGAFVSVMAELLPPDSRMCNYFFLYDGSKVRGEADPTREGICYFYPEEVRLSPAAAKRVCVCVCDRDLPALAFVCLHSKLHFRKVCKDITYLCQTPLDKQELLCGQLAGVGRCVSELSSSPARTLRLRRNKFAIRMKDDFFWALGCSVDVPTVSMCEFLDQLIDLFCFYNGPVRQSYQLNSQETLAAQWARYLSHLQSGSSELSHIFSCLRTIDSTNVDPLLLLKAALILQACQRCPLVLAGCILFRGRVVSTQMSPGLTMKVMVHESETYTKAQKPNGTSTSSSFSGTVSSTTVFLTMPELQYLQSAPVNNGFSSPSTPQRDTPSKKTRLSRTLSDTPSTDSDVTNPSSSQHLQKVSFSPHLSESDVFSPAPSHGAADSLNPSPQLLRPSLSNGEHSLEGETEERRSGSSHNSTGGRTQIHSEGDGSVFEENFHLNGGDGDEACGMVFDFRAAESGNEQLRDDKVVEEDRRDSCGSASGHKAGKSNPPPPPHLPDTLVENPLIPMTLYMHRVNGLVLALLVEPHFMSDATAMEEVYHSSLASLNGLEAHLRTISPGASPAAQGAPGPYTFAHFDCIQSTLTTNLSGQSGGARDHPFVRATSLLHSHFCNTETLQEAIIRSASTAVYGTRSVAQETYFQQNGGSLRNSGIPNHQDSAFSLPSKARHRLLKHGVNLL